MGKIYSIRNHDYAPGGTGYRILVLVRIKSFINLVLRNFL